MSSDFNQELQAERPEGETVLNSGGSREGHEIASSGEFVDIHVAEQLQLQEVGVQTGGFSDDVVGPHRLRIRELEEQMLSRNLELQDKDCLKRNYDAILEKLVKVQAEKQVIEEDREKYCEEMKLYRQQAEDKTKENDVLREWLQEEMKLYGQQAEEMKNENDEYGERLQENTKLYRRQAEEKTKENDEYREKLLFCCCMCVLFAFIVSFLLQTKQFERENLWIEKRENYEVNEKENRTQHSQPMKENWSLCNKHETDLHCQLKRRRHIFHQSPTVLPRCKNCLTVFDHIQPHEIQCSFHRSVPQPFKAWKKQIDEDSQQFDHPYTQAYMHWPCCWRT